MSEKPAYPIIDFHVHAYPDDLAQRAVGELTVKCGFQACFDGTLAGLESMMKQTGVDLSVIQPIATKITQVRTINEWSAGVNQRQGLCAFGTLHPDMTADEIEAEVRFIRAHNLPGVKMHPEYQSFYPDEDRMEKIYAHLQNARRILLLHAGMDVGFPPPVKATPERLLEVVKGFPGLTMVLAHLGGYRDWEHVGKCLAGQPIWLDTAYCLGQPPVEPMLELIRAHSTDRILFASDAPWGDQGQHVGYLQALPFSAEDLKKMAGGNAAALLEKCKLSMDE